MNPRINSTHKEIDPKFGIRLRELRDKVNLSQKKLAKKSEMGSSDSISDYENAKNSPKPASLLKLLKTLLRERAFTEGNELKEAAEFWSLATQDTFPEDWFKQFQASLQIVEEQPPAIIESKAVVDEPIHDTKLLNPEVTEAKSTWPSPEPLSTIDNREKVLPDLSVKDNVKASELESEAPVASFASFEKEEVNLNPDKLDTNGHFRNRRKVLFALVSLLMIPIILLGGWFIYNNTIIARASGCITISKDLALSATKVTIGKPVTASVTIKNACNRVVSIDQFEIGIKVNNTWGSGKKFPSSWDIKLLPGEEYVYSKTRTFDDGGDFAAESVIKLDGSWGGITNLIGEFRAIDFKVI